VNNALPRNPVTAKDLAGQMGRGEGEIEAILEAMANKGLCMAFKRDQTLASYGLISGYISQERNREAKRWSSPKTD
jgi:hypothetical protein